MVHLLPGCVSRIQGYRLPVQLLTRGLSFSSLTIHPSSVVSRLVILPLLVPQPPAVNGMRRREAGREDTGRNEEA